MEILWVITIMMTGLFVKGLYDKKKDRERLILRLCNNWGQLPEEEYPESKLNSLQYYYKNKFKKKQENAFFLDEITWNDLNMSELYAMLNNTGSAMGEEIIWAILHELKTEELTLKEREEVISFFQNNQEPRLKLQTDFALIGKNSKISIYEYVQS